MRGIILAGGSGTRLYPVTKVISKHLLPIHGRPMIYYPIATLMQAGIREICILTNPEHLDTYRALLGSGEELGLSFCYLEQPEAGGIAQALLLGERFLQGHRFALILGDNFFHGEALPAILSEAAKSEGALIFTYPVACPQEFGIAEVSEQGEVLSLQEKPASPKSSLAAVGLYFYDEEAILLAKKLRPSARGELEITDVNQCFLEEGKLRARPLGSNITWMDMGTWEGMRSAEEYLRKEGSPPLSLEELAYSLGFISREKLEV